MKQFSVAKRWFAQLDGETAGKLITVASDVALVISDAHQGVISDVSFGSNELSPELAHGWVGRAWTDTVTSESRHKVEALLRDSSATELPRWRMVNHRSDSGIELPVLYAAVQTRDSGHVVAFGRSMRPMATLQQQLVSAQQSMEREYLKLRQTEARHRLLFQVASEAVLVVDAANRRILEANPAAGNLLGEVSKRLVGRVFPEGFDERSTQSLHNLLDWGEEQPSSARAGGGGDDWDARSEAGSVAPSEGGPGGGAPRGSKGQHRSAMQQLSQRLKHNVIEARRARLQLQPPLPLCPSPWRAFPVAACGRNYKYSPFENSRL